jgi:putative endonuclease
MEDRRQALARRGEDLAVAQLQASGCVVVERNFRTRHCEIDIIARDGDYLCFVEVKTRTSAAFGPAAFAVTGAKQRHIARAARGYLADRSLNDVPCRFDVVTVEFERGAPVVTHIPNAFQDHAR